MIVQVEEPKLLGQGVGQMGVLDQVLDQDRANLTHTRPSTGALPAEHAARSRANTGETVNAVVKDGGPLRPCVILPEELPDE